MTYTAANNKSSKGEKLMNNIWNGYPNLNNDLEAVQDIIRESVKCSEKTIETALMDLVNSGGKLLRPSFVLIGGGFGKGEKDKLCSLGAVVEMLHMSTLIHDDIVDDAALRRGSETIQSKYGKNYAVFMGDFLFCRCFSLLSNSSSMENMKMISKVIERICKGEIEQFSSQFSKEVSIRKYLRRIAAKTAALFSLSLYVGAVESGCKKKLANKLARIGYDIGMAFQIIDDILDFNSDEETIGKPVGNDIKHGIYTIPLIYALESGDERLNNILSKPNYSQEDVSEIIEISRELGGVDRARALAKRYTEKAFKEISTLPNVDSRNTLSDVAKKLIVREY